jgi:hypothetical protein
LCGSGLRDVRGVRPQCELDDCQQERQQERYRYYEFGADRPAVVRQSLAQPGARALVSPPIVPLPGGTPV